MKFLENLLAAVALFTVAVAAEAQTTQTVVSPDGNIKLEVSMDGGISYDVWCGDELVMDDCRLSMNVEGNVLGSQPKLQKASRRAVDQIKKPFLTFKYAEIRDRFNELNLKMKGNYSIIFRVYDDGMAYRFETFFTDEIKVWDEDIEVFFPQGTKLILQQSDRFRTSYEESYSFVKASEWTAYDKMAHYPILAKTTEI